MNPASSAAQGRTASHLHGAASHRAAAGRMAAAPAQDDSTPAGFVQMLQSLAPDEGPAPKDDAAAGTQPEALNAANALMQRDDLHLALPEQATGVPGRMDGPEVPPLRDDAHDTSDPSPDDTALTASPGLVPANSPAPSARWGLTDAQPATAAGQPAVQAAPMALQGHCAAAASAAPAALAVTVERQGHGAIPGAQAQHPGSGGPRDARADAALEAATAVNPAATQAAAERDPALPAASGAPASTFATHLTAATLDAASLAGLHKPLGAEAVPLHQASLASGPHEPRFGGELAAQVQFMVDGGLQQAQLRLNPVELGPVRITLDLSGASANLQLSASHALTREGLLRALPELREALASQGLALGQAEVGAQAHSGHSGHHQAFAQAQEPASQTWAAAPAGGRDAAAGSAAMAPPAQRPRALRGMLDLYA